MHLHVKVIALIIVFLLERFSIECPKPTPNQLQYLPIRLLTTANLTL